MSRSNERAARFLPQVLRRWQRWRTLAAWERQVLLRTAVLLLLVKVELQLVGINRIHRQSRARQYRRRQALPQGWSPLDYAQRCAELTAMVARQGAVASCLPQALVLCRLLWRQGIGAECRIGVQPQQHPFVAHAWVELDGTPLGPMPEQYPAVFSLGKLQALQ